MAAINVTLFLPMIVRITQTCPITAEGWRKSSDRLGCQYDSKDVQNRYHCVPDQDKYSLLEFCYDRSLVAPGYCLELAYRGYLNFEGCDKTFSYGCPTDHYFSDGMYKLPACLQINKANQCFVADPTCPADGGWTSFTFSWSPCTVTCGGGIQSGQEHRTCTNPRPSKTGKPCVGSPHGRKASRECNKQPCPVDGQWSEYGPVSEWSKCSMSCGVGKGIQQRFRKRNCTNPPPQHTGKNCPGSDVHTERKECDVNPCPSNIFCIL